MKQAQLLWLGFSLVTGTLFAQGPVETSACRLYREPNLQGEAWSIATTSEKPFAAELSPAWLGQFSSVWLRQGYVLEAYRDKNFQGASISLGTASLGSDAEGLAVNLASVNFDKTIASLRCRPQGQKMQLPSGELDWVEGAHFQWQSGGNHPNHKSLDLQTLAGDATLLIHADNTYGINRQDYRFNLRLLSVHVELVSMGGQHAQYDFALADLPTHPEFQQYLESAAADLDVLAEGYSLFPGMVEPPKPEVTALAAYLRALLPAL